MSKLIPFLIFIILPSTAPVFAQTFMERHDKNGDGYVTFKEFPGPAKRFRLLDTNRDARISPAEAPPARRVGQNRVGVTPRGGSVAPGRAARPGSVGRPGAGKRGLRGLPSERRARVRKRVRERRNNLRRRSKRNRVPPRRRGPAPGTPTPPVPR
ncbi:hypothetical protein ACFL2Q_02980 [Thermodesulfobacteriota bacterium]